MTQMREIWLNLTENALKLVVFLFGSMVLLNVILDLVSSMKDMITRFAPGLN